MNAALIESVWSRALSHRDPAIEGQTAISHTTVALLQINHADSIALRGSLIAEGIFRKAV